MSTISTNGWDTVFATTYSNINAQIAGQWSTLIAKAPSLGQIKAALPNNKASVSLTVSALQLTQGGSGSIVRMVLPITSGTMSGIDGSYDLSGQSITIELALQWVPEPNQIQFTISSNVSAIETDLGANTTVTSNIIQAFASGHVTLSSSATVSTITKGISWKIADSSSKKSFYVFVTDVGGAASVIEVYQYIANSLVVLPNNNITPVTVISAGNIRDPIDGPIFRELISQNIDENLKEFSFVFASVDVVTNLAKTDVWAWLQPTSNGYAVVEPLQSPNNDNCVSAILSMVNNRVNSKPVLQVDANAIAPNSSSSLLISPIMFLKNILLPGASSVFTGSSQSDFKVIETNLSITNTKSLDWANCKLDDNTTVTLSVDPNNFSMGVENDRITLSFSNLNYPITMLGATVGHVEIIFTGQFQLALKTGTNGNKTLWFDLPKDQKNITNVSAVMNKTYYTIEEAIGIISIALSVIAIGGALGSKLATRAAEKAVIASGEVEAGATAAEIQAVLQDVLQNPPIRRAFIGEAGADALEMLNSAVINIRRANLWASVAKWSASAAALTGATWGGMKYKESVLEEAAQDKWEKTPAFRKFADMSISYYSFGGLSNLQVQTAALAESMQIGFTASS